MKKLIIIGTCFLAAVSAPAEQVTISEFLSTAEHDFDIEYQEEKIRYLEDFSSNFPYLDEVEFRYRNEGFSRSRYSIRLSPYGVGETRAGKKVHNTTYDWHSGRRVLMLNRALRKRYMLVLELLYRRTMLGHNTQLELVFKDCIQVLKGRSGEPGFDFTAILDADDKAADLRLRMIELKSDIRVLEEEILACLPEGSGLDFDTAGLIDIDFIRIQLDSGRFALDTDNVYLKTRRQELALSEARYTLENAQSRRYLDFLELAYDHAEMKDQIYDRDRSRAYDLNRAFIVQLGFKLPFINSDRIDINRRKLAWLDDKGRYEEEKAVLAEDIHRYLGDIRKSLEKYSLLEEHAGHLSSEASLQTYMGIEGIDPLILLRARESSLKSLREIEGLKFSVFISYIKLLDITGKLSENSDVNLISKFQEPLAR